jgi:nitrite reductase/ring-hydroxylating ferredoxin subunit
MIPGAAAQPGAGVALCPADAVAIGQARRFRYVVGPAVFRGLLVRTQTGLRGFVDWCAHQDLPLQDDRDDIIRQDGLLVCAWHWARYDPEDGRGVDGPCVGRLLPWPVEIGADGMVRTI